MHGHQNIKFFSAYFSWPISASFHEHSVLIFHSILALWNNIYVLPLCVVKCLCGELTKPGTSYDSMNHFSGISHRFWLVTYWLIQLMTCSHSYCAVSYICVQVCALVDRFLLRGMNSVLFPLHLPINHIVEKTLELSPINFLLVIDYDVQCAEIGKCSCLMLTALQGMGQM